MPRWPVADSRMGCFLTAIRKEAADLSCWPCSLFGDWSVFFLPDLVSANYSSGKKEAGRQAGIASHRIASHRMAIYVYVGVCQIADTYLLRTSSTQAGGHPSGGVCCCAE